MGTYTSALLCPKCDGGNILDEDPLDQTSAWKYTMNLLFLFKFSFDF